MGSVTLCVIALNEEEMLGECLASATGLVEEIIVVDTGSTDATVEIAKAAGATVVHFPWSGDFSAARNAALPHVNSEWILVLDADERLVPEGIPKIRAAIAGNEFDCGMLRLHNAVRMNATAAEVVSGEGRHQESLRVPRLLRRSIDLKWEGVVHETVKTWLSKGRTIGDVDADLVHYGYVPELIRSRDKDSRNLTLLERRCVQEPHNPVCRAYLAREFIRIGESQRALSEARRAWNTLNSHGASDSMRPAAVTVATVYAFLLMSVEDYESALEVVQRAEEWNSDHPNLHILAGTILQNMAITSDREEELLRAAEASFLFCISQAHETYIEELMPGACTWAAWRGLGEVLIALDRPTEAAHYFEQVCKSGRDDIRSILGMAQSWLMRGKPTTALKTVAPVMQQAKADGWTIAAYACVQVGQFEDASELFHRAHVASRDGFIYPTRQRLLRMVEAALNAKDAFVSIGGVVGLQDPGGTEERVKVGEAAFQSGDVLRAQVSFMEAIAHELVSPVAWLNLGVVYHDGGSQREAIQCLRTAVELGINDPNTHHNLALILWEVGRTDEAIVVNREALNIDPNHTGARLLHARMGCQGWAAPRALVVGPSILGCSRAHGAISNYMRLIGFSVRWAQPEVVDLLEGKTAADRVASFMDRSEPSLLVLSSQGMDTQAWIQEAAARAIPVVCEGGERIDIPETVHPLSDEPTKSMRDIQEFLDVCQIGPSKPLITKWEPIISVVIPTRNRPNGLLRLLDRLGSQDLHPSLYEVIVVDDGSEIPARDVVGTQAYPFQLSVIRVDDHLGSGHARNVGVEQAAAPLLLFFDDDTMPAVDNLRGHVLMQNATTDAHLVTGGFELVDSRGDLSMSQEAMQTVAFDLRDLRPDGPSEPEGFFACNASIPTDIVRELGGFDSERFPEPVMDDIDFGYRLETSGVAIRHCPELRCDRDHEISVDLFLEYCFNLGYYHHRLNEAHPNRPPVSLVYRDQVEHENFDLSLRSVAEQETVNCEGFVAELRRFEQMVGPFDLSQRSKLVKQLGMMARKVSVAPYCRGMVTARIGQESSAPVEDEAPLSGKQTSVIIPNLNGFPHIIGCLESLRRTSEGPVEVIVVDNGSVDGSLEWLRTQDDIVLVEMGENVGAPAARNRALEVAVGDTILFCDNDVVFTPKWRSLMMNHLEAWPDVGIVGPMSDYVVGDQKTAEIPKENESLGAFGERFTAQYRGQHQYAMRLILFCMLVRREVIDKIGGFDQAFGQWGFEDDDFTLRAKLAGYQMRVAKDCFIRHIGSQTAYTAKLNYQNLLIRNWGVFKTKWGIETVPYGATVSLVDILKDKVFAAEKHIENVQTGTMTAYENSGILLRPVPASRRNEVVGTGGVDQETTDEIISKFSPALGKRGA